MVSDAPINLTQLAGLLAFGAAALAAAFAARANASSGRRASTQWWGVCIFQLLFLAEIWLGTRHAMHDMVNAWLRDMGIYQDRAVIQKWMLVTIAISGLIAGFAWLRTVMQTGEKSVLVTLAGACTAAVVVLFLMETVSLHAIDRLLYRQTGPLLLIAYAWIAGAGAIIVLAWRSATSRH